MKRQRCSAARPRAEAGASFLRRWLIIGAGAVAVIAALALLGGGDQGAAGRYICQKEASIRQLTVTVSACGAHSPQIGGRGQRAVGTLATVLAQENSRVKEGASFLL